MSIENGTLYALHVPPGTLRDPDEPHDAAVLMVVAAIFLPLATLIMGIRMYTRISIVRKLSLDDYLMVLAWAFDVLLVAFVLNMINFGLGKHLWNVPMQPDLYPKFSLTNLLAAVFFCVATGLAKGSILLFYLRIFPVRTVRIAVWAVFAFTIGYSIACGLVNIFSCNPIRASWRVELVEGASCIDRPVFYFAQAALSIAADVATVVIPVPLLRTLHLPSRQRVGVAVLLTLGAFVCIVSIVRLHSLYVLLTDADLTRNTVMALMWCILEINLSIIGGCIPAAKPFIQRLFPKLLGSYGGGSVGNNMYLYSSRKGASHVRSTHGTTSNYKGTVPSSARYDDTGSEEYIIRQTQDSAVNDEPEGQIVKTVEYGYDIEGATSVNRA